MLLFLIMTLSDVSIAASDLDDVDRVAAICKSASSAEGSAHDPRAWIKAIDQATAELSSEQSEEVLKMCAMYSAGVRDTAQQDLDQTIEQLQNNNRQLKQVLEQQHQ